MSYEIIAGKTANGLCLEARDVEENENIEEENIVEDQDTSEELNTSILSVIFKKRIGPHDRRIQKLNSDLLSSIQRNDIETFSRCLQEGANPSAVCRETGLSASHVSVLYERCHFLDRLLIAGANDSFSSWQNGYLPIHVAAWRGCITCLKTLATRTRSNIFATCSIELDVASITQTILDSWDHDHKLLGAEIPPTYEKSTPLHVACKKLNFQCAEYLINENADTKMVDGRGQTPLDVVYEVIMASNICDRNACNDSHIRSTTDVEKSRDSSAANSVHEFHQRAWNEFVEIKMESDDASKIISLLIDHDSKFSATPSSYGVHSAIMEKCESFLFPATVTQNEKLLKILLNKNVDLSVRDENGDTILHFAVRHRLKRSLFILLKSEKIKSVLERKDSEGRTPLIISIASMWNTGASMLLESGASATAATNDGNTTLHFAARTTNTSIIDGLFSYSETEKIKNYKNRNEETAIMVAVMHNNVDCVRKLMNFGVCLRLTSKCNRTLLHVAAENGYTRILKLILREDLDIKEAKTDNNETALHLAASGGHLECTQFLLSVGCCVTAITTNVSTSFNENFDFGGTALHFAAWKGRLSVVQCLVDYNADLVNVANLNKWFPLHIAIYFNYAECAEHLIKKGANLAYTVPFANGYLRSSFDILSYTLANPVSFLENVFNSYVEKNDLPLTHPDCCIVLKFDILSPKGGNKKQMKVLNALLNNDDEVLQRQMLLHPLIETFLHLKWKKLRTFFNVTTLLYACFTVNLTLFALSVDDTRSTATNVILLLMLINLFPLAALEILHARKLQRYYVKDLESWLKWFTYGLTLLIGGRAAVFSLRGVDHSPWNDIAAVPVLLAWIETLFLLSRYPTWGFYILMFFRVAFDVIKVFCTFASLIFGFLFSFYIFFKHEKNSPFYSLQETFVRIIAMTSEFEYSATFQKSDDLLSDLISRFLFIVFVVLVAIVLMNLMVGLAVSDIATLQAQGRSQTLAKQIDFLYVLERLVYNEKLLNLLPQNVKMWMTENRNIPSTLSIYPNRPFDKKSAELPTELKRLILLKVSLTKEIKSSVLRNRAEIAKRLQLLNQELEFINRELLSARTTSISSG